MSVVFVIDGNAYIPAELESLSGDTFISELYVRTPDGSYNMTRVFSTVEQLFDCELATRCNEVEDFELDAWLSYMQEIEGGPVKWTYLEDKGITYFRNNDDLVDIYADAILPSARDVGEWTADLVRNYFDWDAWIRDLLIESTHWESTITDMQFLISY